MYTQRRAPANPVKCHMCAHTACAACLDSWGDIMWAPWCAGCWPDNCSQTLSQSCITHDIIDATGTLMVTWARLKWPREICAHQHQPAQVHQRRTYITLLFHRDSVPFCAPRALMSWHCCNRLPCRQGSTGETSLKLACCAASCCRAARYSTPRMQQGPWPSDTAAAAGLVAFVDRCMHAASCSWSARSAASLPAGSCTAPQHQPFKLHRLHHGSRVPALNGTSAPGTCACSTNTCRHLRAARHSMDAAKQCGCCCCCCCDFKWCFSINSTSSRGGARLRWDLHARLSLHMSPKPRPHIHRRLAY